MNTVNYTILIIEDDLGLNELISEKIQEIGYRTHSAFSAGEALNWLTENAAFLIIVDYNLSDITAKEFIDTAKIKGLNLPPFIVSTGQGNERIAVDMMKLGARDYIIKDTNLLELMPRVINRVVNEIESEIKLKLAEDALRKNEEKYRILFAENPQPMFVYNIDTLDILEVNQTAINFYGYSKEECLNMSIKALHPAEDIHDFTKKIEQTKLGANTDGITKHIKKNGEIIIVEIFSAPANFLDENARLALVVDITERKILENVHNFLHNCGISVQNISFFESIAKYLSEILEMEYVCIDILDVGGLTAHTLAIYNDGAYDTNVSYTLKDTPCGEVVGKDICSYPENVCNLFPHDAALRDLNAESYIGTTLWSFDNKPIGLIAVISHKPLKNILLKTKILRLVSIRAASELERKKGEDALIKKNQDLDYMNKFMVNREVRMAEMKKEVNEMLERLGEEKRYL